MVKTSSFRIFFWGVNGVNPIIDLPICGFVDTAIPPIYANLADGLWQAYHMIPMIHYSWLYHLYHLYPHHAEAQHPAV